MRRSALEDPKPVAEFVAAFVSARLFVTDHAADGMPIVALAHEALVTAWAPLRRWSDDSRAAAVVGQDGLTRVWSLTGPKVDPIHVLPLPDESSVEEYERISDGVHVAFSHDARRIAVAGLGPVVRVWELDDRGDPPVQFRGTDSDVSGVAFRPGDRQLVATTGDFRHQWLPNAQPAMNRGTRSRLSQYGLLTRVWREDQASSTFSALQSGSCPQRASLTGILPGTEIVVPGPPGSQA